MFPMARILVAAALLVGGIEIARAQLPPPPPPPPPPPGPMATRDRPMATGTAVVRGRVVADGSNAPIPRVEVRISSPESPSGRVAMTDGSGRYELANLPAGRFTLAASKAN